MDLSSLKPAKGSVRNKKRLGRGEGSGKGGTSSRGNKGAQSRSGYKKTRGFEGGQMPLQRTSPKFGFRNMNRLEYKAINVSTLQYLAEKSKVENIDFNVLLENGLIAKKDKVKILGQGELSIKVNVKAHAFSKAAVQKIEALGGIAEKI